MKYGSWHSDPVKAQEYVDALRDAYYTLRAGEPPSTADAKRVFSGIFRILCDEESEFDYDDAWDTLGRLRPRHVAAIPVLAEALEPGRCPAACSNAKYYPIEALGKIDPDGTRVREILVPLLQDPDPEIRERAKSTLNPKRSCFSRLFNR